MRRRPPKNSRTTDRGGDGKNSWLASGPAAGACELPGNSLAQRAGPGSSQRVPQLAEREISPADPAHVLELTRAIHDHPLEIIEGVEETLDYLAGRHDLILVTKGDRKEQQRKIDASGLGEHF